MERTEKPAQIVVIEMSELPPTKKWENELRCWKLDSPPIEEVAHNSYSESHSWCEGVIFKLASGQYVTILGRGCSCHRFGEDERDVKYHQNFVDAWREYNEWKAQEDKSTYWTSRT